MKAGKFLRVFGMALMGLWMGSWLPVAGKSMKGLELYAWQDQHQWRYALTAGTNAIKSWESITKDGVDSLDDLKTLIQANGDPGEQIFWAGQSITMYPESRLPPREVDRALADLCANLGMRYREISEAARAEFARNTPSGKSHRIPAKDLGFQWQLDPMRLIVAAVRPSSAADDGKFLKADVLLKVEGTAVSTPKAFEERVANFAPGQRIKLQVLRGKGTQDLFLLLPDADVSRPWTIFPQTLPDLTGVMKLNQDIVLGPDGLYRKHGALYTGQATYGASTVIGLSTFDEGRYMHFVEWVNGKKHNETWKNKEGRVIRQARYNEQGEMLSDTRPR